MLEPCPACHRHVADETACPFCGAALAPLPPRATPVGRFSRAALFAGLAGCWTGNDAPTQTAPPPPGDERVVHDHQVRPQAAAGGAIEVTMTDAQTGQPMPYTSLQLMGPDGATKTISTDANGHYLAADLAPGTYSLQWGHPRFGGLKRFTVTVGAGATVRADLATNPPPVRTPNMPYGAPPSRKRIV
jgi:hypothetical protein